MAVCCVAVGAQATVVWRSPNFHGDRSSDQRCVEVRRIAGRLIARWMRPLTAEREVQRGARLPAGAGHKRVARARSGRARRGKTRRVARQRRWRPPGAGAVRSPAARRSCYHWSTRSTRLLPAVSARNPGGCGSVSLRVVAAGRARSAGSYTIRGGYRTVRIAPPRVTK